MFSFGALGTSNSSLSSSTATATATATAASAYLYARLNSRHLLELNCSTLHLSLITPPSCSTTSSLLASTTTSKHLYTIEGIQGRPVGLAVNSLGSTVAVSFDDSKTIAVLRNLQHSSSIEVVQIHLTQAALWMDWHPLSPGDSHLAVLTRGNQLLLFDTLAHTEEAGLEAEIHLKLPANRLDPLVRCSFIKTASTARIAADWSLLGVFLVSEAGDVRFLAPFLPRHFKVKRSEWLEALLYDDAEIDGTARKWLQSCLQGAKFLSTPEGDTDWCLIDCAAALTAFDSLQPALQGPFPIQPEPLEIHNLSSFDRVCDFMICEDAETMAIAFASGKIDLLAFSGFLPAWQLTGQSGGQIGESNSVLVLLESIDVALSQASISRSAKRSVYRAIKFIHSSFDSLLVSPGNDQVISIGINYTAETIECSAIIVASGLKAPAQSFLLGRVFPGAVSIDVVDAVPPALQSSSALSPDLLKITNFAFPLGKLEIEGAALQLEGLLESTLKALHRLKTHQSTHLRLKGSRLCAPSEEASEEDCAALNEELCKWQQEVVMPAMRVGHELALRAQELVQILRTQRHVLTRAHALLTSKPERLQNLLRSLSTATQKNAQLQQRLKTLKEKMPSGEGRLDDGALINALQNMNSRLGNCMNASPARGSDLVDVQLALQTEILTKLQKLLQ
jgi:hypothetical protein